MKFLQCVIYGYLFYCFVDNVGGDFNGWIVNIRTEVGSAMSTAWNSLITAIKKPVRIRNIRRKRRTTTTPSSDIIYRDMDEPESFQLMNSDQTGADVEAINPADTREYHLKTEYKPKIPVIYQPEWKSMVDWASLHRPSLVQLIQEIRDRRRSTRETTILPPETIITDTAERTKRISIDEDEDRHFELTLPVIKPGASHSKTTALTTVPGRLSSKGQIVEYFYLHSKCQLNCFNTHPNIPSHQTFTLVILDAFRDTGNMIKRDLSVKMIRHKTNRLAAPVNKLLVKAKADFLVTTPRSNERLPTEDVSAVVKSIQLGKYKININYKWHFD